MTWQNQQYSMKHTQIYFMFIKHIFIKYIEHINIYVSESECARKFEIVEMIFIKKLSIHDKNCNVINGRFEAKRKITNDGQC